jgi:hypothetical protein
MLAASGLSPAAAYKIAGYPFQSGLQHHLESEQLYLHPKVIVRLARLIGHGSPPITEAQIQALAVDAALLARHTDPVNQFTRPQPTGNLQLPDRRGSPEVGGQMVEGALLRDLLRQMDRIENDLQELKRAVAGRQPRPPAARRG